MSAMKKILVIEDDSALSLILIDNLTKEGFDIIQARDGEEGLASALSVKPDLILLDIILPKMDGLTMLGKLRQDSWGKNVPVIVLSNLSDPLDIAKAAIDGVHEYLVKVDWEIKDVVKKIREKLKS